MLCTSAASPILLMPPWHPDDLRINLGTHRGLPFDGEGAGATDRGAEGLAPISRLPPDLLARVLTHDPLHHRLTAAAAVCQAWRKAAAATVTSLTYKSLLEPQLRAMLMWAAKEASHLAHLQLWARPSKSDAGPLLQQLRLPAAAQLKSLDLRHMQLQLGPSGGNIAGILTALTALTSLKLQQNSLLDGATGLKHLSEITGLQDLQLSGNTSATYRFPRGVLSRLVQLTRLALCSMEVPVAALHGLSLLSGLKHLSLSPQKGGKPLSQEVLRIVVEQQQLTWLELGAAAAAIRNSSTPGFSRLTALQMLAVRDCMTTSGCGLHPEVLVNMTALRKLNLGCSFVLGGEAGVAAMLALPSLQQLQKLDLANSLWQRQYRQPQVSARHYSTLTSSSQLSSLALAGCMLPEGVLPLLFNRQLPHLRVLDLSAAKTARLTTAEVQLIARCCPGLQCLFAASVLHGQADLAALQDCTQLTSLHINKVNNTKASTLARLTRLQEQVVTAPNDLTADALGTLSHLKQLTFFCVYDKPAHTLNGATPAETAARWCFKTAAPDEGPSVAQQMYEIYRTHRSKYIWTGP